MNVRFFAIVAAGLLLPAAALAQPASLNSASPSDSAAIINRLQKPGTH